MNLDIINLGLNHLSGAVRRTPEILWEGSLMVRMNKFTLLGSPISTTGHKEGKNNSLKDGFLDGSGKTKVMRLMSRASFRRHSLSDC